MRWAACSGDPALAGELRAAAPVPLGTWQVLVVAVPEPAAPSEAHFVAYARPALGGPLRYFVLEKASTGPGEPPRAFMSEWTRDGMRVRYGDASAVSVDAFLAQVTAELSAQSAAPPPPMFNTSMAPMAVPPAPKKGGAGKWIALGSVGVLGSLVAGYLILDHYEKKEWRERYEREQAAEKAAEHAYEAARERSEKTLADLAKPRAACLAAEGRAAQTAVERAVSKSSLRVSLRRPKADAAMAGAAAYLPPDDKGQTQAAFARGGAWIPTTPWISRDVSTCKAPSPSHAALKSALGEAPIERYAANRQEKLEERAQQLDALEEAASDAPTPSAPALTTIAVTDMSCTQVVVASYNTVFLDQPTSGGGVAELFRYDCTAKIHWIDLEGQLIAAASARAGANPATQPASTTASALGGINDATYQRARDDAAAALQKTITDWGGGVK